jgi:hypothetical protein
VVRQSFRTQTNGYNNIQLFFSPASGFLWAQTFPTYSSPHMIYPDPKKNADDRPNVMLGFCGKRTALECLAGRGNFFGRLFSGASTTFSVVQRGEILRFAKKPLRSG